MADEEKTEEPTAKRREKAREDGDIPTSRDLGGVAIATVALVVLLGQAESMLGSIRMLFVEVTNLAKTSQEHEAGALVATGFAAAGHAVLNIASAVLATTLIVAVAVGLAFTGGNWSSKAIGFKLDRLKLLSGIKRALFSGQALQQVGLSLVKAAVLGTVLGLLLYGSVEELAGLASVGLEPGMLFVAELLVQLVVAALASSGVLGIIDYLLTRRRSHEKMKMSKQEVKDEHKQQEGDPQVKGRLRQRMREIGRNQMLSATRKADVVVVNPTHYAVALAYKFGQEGAPKVLAKGKDHVAAKIREIARKNQIPIVANPPVARAIYAAAKIGREVPPELYESVAKVLAYLFKLGRQRFAA